MGTIWNAVKMHQLFDKLLSSFVVQEKYVSAIMSISNMLKDSKTRCALANWQVALLSLPFLSVASGYLVWPPSRRNSGLRKLL